ncbi:Conserved_hypothetical protein [Hexamita inflata]|uniref:Ubiquitin-like protease family profile domain-containing protein n=3 Tax=Hexamita inflata TaxID=28002 RepID=A0AA86UAF2_9EUKA|nr:Conserved hypothetical protein [Hexamita inflata]
MKVCVITSDSENIAELVSVLSQYNVGYDILTNSDAIAHTYNVGALPDNMYESLLDDAQSFVQYDSVLTLNYTSIIKEPTIQYSNRYNSIRYKEKLQLTIDLFIDTALTKFLTILNTEKFYPSKWTINDLNIFKDVEDSENSSFGSIGSLNPQKEEKASTSYSEQEEKSSDEETNQNMGKIHSGKMDFHEGNMPSDCKSVVKQNLVQGNQQMQTDNQSSPKLEVQDVDNKDETQKANSQETIKITFDNQSTAPKGFSHSDHFQNGIRQYENNNQLGEGQSQIVLEFYEIQDDQKADDFDLVNISKRLKSEKKKETQFERVQRLTGKQSDYDFNKYTIPIERTQQQNKQNTRSFSGIRPGSNDCKSKIPKQNQGSKTKHNLLNEAEHNNQQILQTQKNFQKFINSASSMAMTTRQDLTRGDTSAQGQLENNGNQVPNTNMSNALINEVQITVHNTAPETMFNLDIQEPQKQTLSEISHQRNDALEVDFSQIIIEENHQEFNVKINIGKDSNMLEFFLTKDTGNYSNDIWKKAMRGRKSILNTSHGHLLISTIPKSVNSFPIIVQVQVNENFDTLINNRKMSDDLMGILINTLPQDNFNIINPQICQFGIEILPIEANIYNRVNRKENTTFAPFIYSQHWYLCIIDQNKLYICDSLNGFAQAQKILVQETEFSTILNNICEQHFGKRDADSRTIEAIQLGTIQTNDYDCGFVIFFLMLQIMQHHISIEKLSSIDNSSTHIQELRKRIVVFLSVYDRLKQINADQNQTQEKKTEEKKTEEKKTEEKKTEERKTEEKKTEEKKTEKKKTEERKTEEKKTGEKSPSKEGCHKTENNASQNTTYQQITKEDLYGFNLEPIAEQSLKFRINNEFRYISIEDAKYVAIKNMREEEQRTGNIDQFDILKIEDSIKNAEEYVMDKNLVKNTIKMGVISSNFTNMCHKPEIFNFKLWLSNKNLYNDNKFTDLFGHLSVHQILKPCKFKIANKLTVAFHDPTLPFIFANTHMEFQNEQEKQVTESFEIQMKFIRQYDDIQPEVDRILQRFQYNAILLKTKQKEFSILYLNDLEDVTESIERNVVYTDMTYKSNSNVILTIRIPSKEIANQFKSLADEQKKNQQWLEEMKQIQGSKIQQVTSEQNTTEKIERMIPFDDTKIQIKWKDSFSEKEPTPYCPQELVSHLEILAIEQCCDAKMDILSDFRTDIQKQSQNIKFDYIQYNTLKQLIPKSPFFDQFTQKVRIKKEELSVTLGTKDNVYRSYAGNNTFSTQCEFNKVTIKGSGLFVQTCYKYAEESMNYLDSLLLKFNDNLANPIIAPLGLFNKITMEGNTCQMEMNLHNNQLIIKLELKNIFEHYKQNQGQSLSQEGDTTKSGKHQTVFEVVDQAQKVALVNPPQQKRQQKLPIDIDPKLFQMADLPITDHKLIHSLKDKLPYKQLSNESDNKQRRNLTQHPFDLKPQQDEGFTIINIPEYFQRHEPTQENINELTCLITKDTSSPKTFYDRKHLVMDWQYYGYLQTNNNFNQSYYCNYEQVFQRNREQNLIKISCPLNEELVKIDHNSQWYQAKVSFQNKQKKILTKDILIKNAFNQRWKNQPDIVIIFVIDCQGYIAITQQLVTLLQGRIEIRSRNTIFQQHWVMARWKALKFQDMLAITIFYYIEMGVRSRVQRLQWLQCRGSWVNHTRSGPGGVTATVFKLEMSRPRPLVRLVMQNSSQKDESESLAARWLSTHGDARENGQCPTLGEDRRYLLDIATDCVGYWRQLQTPTVARVGRLLG